MQMTVRIGNIGHLFKPHIDALLEGIRVTLDEMEVELPCSSSSRESDLIARGTS